MTGDSNVVSWLNEKQNATRSTNNMRKFNHFISTNDLIDPPMLNGSFTDPEWGKDHRPRGLLDSFYRFGQMPSPDVGPFPFSVDDGAFKGPSPFRFENNWLEDPNFKKNVEVWWAEQNPIGGRI